MATLKSGKIQLRSGPYPEVELTLLDDGVLEYKSSEVRYGDKTRIELRPNSKAEISEVSPHDSFSLYKDENSQPLLFRVNNPQDLEPWVNLINFARARRSARTLLHEEHPLTELDYPIRMSPCVGCKNNLIISHCEFCDEGKFQLCRTCHDATKNLRSPFFKSKSHKHELMRFEQAMDPKFFPRAYNTGEFICSVCNGTSAGPVYHCVECGDQYDECHRCMNTVTASPFAVMGAVMGASLHGNGPVRKEPVDTTGLNLALLAKNVTKNAQTGAYSLIQDPKHFPYMASAIAHKPWDLSKIATQPVSAYFEVTFDAFDDSATVGIGIGNQIFVPNKYLGAQKNSFGYLNNGLISKNGESDYGHDVAKIEPGDTVGAGILYDSFNQRRFYFTKNGKMIDYRPVAFTDFVHDGMDCFPGVSMSRDSAVVFRANLAGPFKFNPSTIPNYRADRRDRITLLPTEILTDILTYAAVSPLQVAEMRRVSKRFSELGASNPVWRKLFMDRWPKQNRKLQLKSWLTLYKRRAAVDVPQVDYEPIHIENCNLEFTCPLLWENLKSTNTDLERFCDKCKKTVYAVDDMDTLRQYSLLGRCVSLRNIPPPPPPNPVDDMWHMPLGGPPPPMDWNPPQVPPLPPGPIGGPPPPIPPPPRK